MFQKSILGTLALPPIFTRSCPQSPVGLRSSTDFNIQWQRQNVARWGQPGTMLNLHIRVTLSLEDNFIRLFKLITCEIAVYYNFIITGSKCKTAGQSFAEKRGSKEKRKFSGFGDGGRLPTLGLQWLVHCISQSWHSRNPTAQDQKIHTRMYISLNKSHL